MFIETTGEFCIDGESFKILNMDLTTNNKDFKIMYKLQINADRVVGLDDYESRKFWEYYLNKTEKEGVLPNHICPPSRSSGSSTILDRFKWRNVYFEKFLAVCNFIKFGEKWRIEQLAMYLDPYTGGMCGNPTVDSRIDRIFATTDTEDSWIYRGEK